MNKSLNGPLRFTLLASVSIALYGCAPDGKIAAISNIEACSAELSDALHAFRNDLGMSFSVHTSDAQTIISTGKIEKPYALAGNSYVGFFGIEKASDECRLKLYKQSIKGPGTSKTESRSQWVELNACQCE